MARMKLAGIESREAGDGGSFDLAPGVYVARITSADLMFSKKKEEALVVTWDVAEGDCTGFFSRSEYPPKEWLMLEGAGAPFAKWKLEQISASNSNPPVTFDAVAAVDAYQHDTLVGKLVGLVVGFERYTKNNGSDGTRNFVARWCTAQEARQGWRTDDSGKQVPLEPPAERDSRRPGVSQAAQSATNVADDDIPF